MHHEQFCISRQRHLKTPQAVSRRFQMFASCLEPHGRLSAPLQGLDSAFLHASAATGYPQGKTPLRSAQHTQGLPDARAPYRTQKAENDC